MVVMEGEHFKRKAYFRTVIYSVAQLTTGCVDETSMRAYTSTSLRIVTMTSDSVVYNELNRCLSLAIVIVGTLPPNCLSERNSLNAICYQSNYMNFVFPQNRGLLISDVLKLTSSCHEGR